MSRILADIRHGEYAGYIAEVRRNLPVCDDCRKARNVYMRVHRSTERNSRRDEESRKARMNALVTLRKRHLAEYETLYVEALQKLRGETK